MSKSQKRRVPLRWYVFDMPGHHNKDAEMIIKYSRGADAVPAAIIFQYALGDKKRWVGFKFATFRPEASLPHRVAFIDAAGSYSFSSLEEAKKELAAWCQKHTAWT